MRLLFPFTKTFVFNGGQIIECEKQFSRGDESPMGLHYLKKHVLSANFHWRQKIGVNNFSMVKEYGRQEVSSTQVLIFVSVCVVVFLTSIFLF